MTEAELRRWMDEYGPRLIAISIGICRDRHRAEEVVQDAFVKLWRKPPDGGAPVYPAWLRRVVTNASINVLQRTKRPSALPEYGDDRAVRSPDRAHQTMASHEDAKRLQDALDRLDPVKRAILVLRGAEGMTYDAIATHLDIPVGTVMSRLNRARAALREVLAEMSEEDTDGTVFSFEAFRDARA